MAGNSGDRAPRAGRSRRGGVRRRGQTRQLDPSHLALSDMRARVEELELQHQALTAHNEELRAAYAELGAAHERYRALFEWAPVGYLTFNEQGRIGEVNACAAALLGADRHRLAGRELAAFLPPESRAVLERHRRALARGDRSRVDELVLGEAGEDQRVVQIRTIPEEGAESPDRPGYRSALLDITELKQAQASVQAEGERLAEHTERLEAAGSYRENLLNSLGEGLFALDVAGRFTFLNQAALGMLGFASQEEVRGRESHGLVHGTDTAHRENLTSRCPLLQVLATGEALQGWEDWFWRADGSRVPVVLDATPVRQGDQILGVVVAFAGRSARQVALHQLTPRERQVLHHLSQGLTNKEVALRLGISHRTVEDHRAHLMERLGVGSLAELVRLT